MATPKIVPRVDGEGSLGFDTRGWGGAFVTNTTASSATEGGKLVLAANDGAVMADNHRLGVIEFKGAEDGSSTLSIGARIEAICRDDWGGSDNDADLEFYTTNGTTESKALTLSAENKAIFSGPVTATGGIQSEAAALTAEDAGRAIIAGTAVVLVDADDDANHIVILPIPVVGNIITIIENDTTGYELRTSTPGSIGINGGTGSNAESAIAGAITYVKCVCVSSTSWICSQYDADGDESKVTAAA